MKTPIALIVVLLIGLGVFVYFEDSLFSHVDKEVAQTNQEQETAAPENNTVQDDTEFCIQVITPARNSETGEIREFPTPCDVPQGWEPIAPEGLDVDLETL